MSKKDTELSEQLAAMREQNEEIMPQLTNKNTEYFHQLERYLTERDFNEDERTNILNVMLVKTLELQDEHIPARRFFGPPVERANKIKKGQLMELIDGSGELAEEEVSPLWQRYVDGALLLGGFFAAINGITAYSQGDVFQTSGLGELLLNFLLGGLVMLVFNHYAPTHRDKKSIFRYTLASVGAMVAWIVSIALLKGAALRWPGLNPQIPAWLVIGIGLLALVGKHFFKKHFEVTGTMF